MPSRKTIKALIVVRTYPIPAKPGVEASCTAAITEDGKWVRLYPVPYRFLDQDKRFRKYQWIEVNVVKASDARPESYTPDIESINILTDPLPTENEWAARKKYVFPARAHCLCCLKRERDANQHPTLGVFKPKVIERLRITPTDSTWTQEQINMLRQGDLFKEQPTTELEKVPFLFTYTFRCDDDHCPGHTISCTDWEMGESWRRWSRKYGDEWQEKFRQRYEREMIDRNDTHFFVGTIHKHPNNWLIIGLFYPPKPQTQDLFGW
ncbi:MAG: hypothetical protein ACJ74Q_09000 [Pyrinomonadaceae bacterium]